jgi:hypothetical protein
MRILSQLQTLDEALDAWQRYTQIPFERFAQEKDVQYMVCHGMLLALQASIDIATGIAVIKTPKRHLSGDVSSPGEVLHYPRGSCS